MKAGEWRMCGSKLRYKNAAHAMRHADRANRGQGRKRERLRAYRCPVCGQWHLTKDRDGR